MKLAFYVPRLAAGGAQHVVVQLANGLSRRGHGVEIVLNERTGPHLANVDDRVSVASLGTAHASRAVPRLVRYLRRQAPDVLVSSLEHANAIATLAGRIAFVPVVPVVHNMVSPLLHHEAWRIRATAWLAMQAYRRSPRVIAVSPAVARDLEVTMGVDPDRIDVIENPVDVDAVRRASLDGPPPERPRPHLVAVGRLEPVKGFDVLLDAFARVRETRGGHLTIFGEGSAREALTGQIEHLGLADAVTLAGFDPNPWPTVARADALVVSSHDEGFGLTLVEAMALGTPVVTTCGDGAPGDIVEGGQFGHIARTGDADDLAVAIGRALDAPVSADLLVKRAARWAPDRALDRWDALLTSRRRDTSAVRWTFSP
ncbi:MAG: glycosyltransferase [Myxococcota bacterium]